MKYMSNNHLSQMQIQSMNKLIDEVSSKQKSYFGNIASSSKADGTLITECDIWSDKTIINGINDIAKEEGILSEEGSKIVPDTSAYWIVDPLDGTTNFAAGIPYWAISIARFVNGKPETSFLEIPPLNKRIIAIRGKGVWINGKVYQKNSRNFSNSECISLCSRSIRVLQRNPNQPFPGKIRLLGVSSLNMVSVCLGQTLGALEATPKIWDIAAAWLILSELGCCLKWLDRNPSDLQTKEDLSNTNFPLIVASSNEKLQTLIPWGNILISG